MWKQTKICVLLFLTLSILTGLIYPLLITAVAQLIFPSQANGSLILKDGKIVGSRLIGQRFADPGYFWGRPSATRPAYNAARSSGSNFGPMNPELTEIIKQRLAKLHSVDRENTQPVPVDLVTASSSGLDPHISMAAAQYQKARIARLRDMPETRVQELIDRSTTLRLLGLMGEPVVNVLELNLALDETTK